MPTHAKLWRHLLFVCIAAGVLYGLVRFAYYRPRVRLKPGVTDPLPPNLTAKPGQTGIPPCWVFALPVSESETVHRGRAAECPLLIPAQDKLDLIEVNLLTGAFLHVATDLFLPARPAIAFTRVSRPVDAWARNFGVFFSYLYNDFPVGDRFPYTYLNLITADGQRFAYDRISQGTGYADALYRHEETRTVLYRSKIGWNGNGWDLTLNGGSQLIFPDTFFAKRPQQDALVGLRETAGNLLRLVRDKLGNLHKIVCQDGQWMEVHNDLERISTVNDSGGKLAQYLYDGFDRMRSVLTPNGTIYYTYDDANRVVSIHKDNALLLQNEYDSLGRIATLMFSNGESYRFIHMTYAYGEPRQTRIVPPREPVIDVIIHGHWYEIVGKQ